MLAGVRLAHHCSYPGLAQILKNDWPEQNSQYRKHIDDTPYLHTIEDSYAVVADNMSFLEQYVLSCDSVHGLRLGLDL